MSVEDITYPPKSEWAEAVLEEVMTRYDEGDLEVAYGRFVEGMRTHPDTASLAQSWAYRELAKAAILSSPDRAAVETALRGLVIKYT